MRILIAEDDQIAGRLLAMLLEPYGDCVIAPDGVRAVREFEKAWEEGNPFGLICLDIMLPEVDGYEVLKSVREFEISYHLADNEKARIIMTTALNDEESFLKAHARGSEWYMTKPIERAQLQKVLNELGVPPLKRQNGE